MTWKKEYNRSVIGGLAFIAIAYFLTPIIVYLIISSIIAAIGRPIMRVFGKIKIKHKPLSSGFRAAIVLVLMISMVSLLASVLTPAISSQAAAISSINVDSVSEHIDRDLGPLKNFLSERSLMNDKASIRQLIRSQIVLLLRGVNFNSVFSSILGVTGELFMGAFAIIFMTFFFLKEETLFTWIVMLFVSRRNHNKMQKILEKIRKTLSKYFFGIMIEVTSMMIILTIGGYIIGIKNAILIGFLGGLLNVIPYLGPLIGATIGAGLVFLANIALGFEGAVILSGEVLLVFAIGNLIDNFVLQPIIYSNSVDIHPMAIFIIIFVGGYIGGPLGMIVAVPMFTVIRIILAEFFPDDPFVQKITQGI
jgi:predicted PurR-regulated permease PerM